MADISKITLPSGNSYDIKDATARQMIAGGITFTVSWDGVSQPVVANIPAGVVVTYNDTDYTGTMSTSSADPGTFYLIKSGTGTNRYDEYVVADNAWEKLGSQEIDLSNLGDLAYKDSAAVTFTGGTTDKCLGSDATFTTTVTPTTTNIKATASGTTVGANGTDTFIKSYSGASSKLVTTSVPNVSNVTAVALPTFTMGTGADAETLIIGLEASGSESASKVTLGTAITAATGSLADNGGGASVMTGLGTATTASALTGVKVNDQPTITLSTGATAGTGVISIATGITSAATTPNNKDEVTAVTSIGTGTAA